MDGWMDADAIDPLDTQIQLQKLVSEVGIHWVMATMELIGSEVAHSSQVEAGGSQ